MLMSRGCAIDVDVAFVQNVRNKCREERERRARTNDATTCRCANLQRTARVCGFASAVCSLI
jgi:hypothetical protein